MQRKPNQTTATNQGNAYTKHARSTISAPLLNSSHFHLRLRFVVPLSDGSPIFLPHIHHNQEFLIHCSITILCPALPKLLELDIWEPLWHISILEFVSIFRWVAYPCLSLTLEEPPINIRKLFLGSRREWSPISAVRAAVPASEHLLKTLLGGWVSRQGWSIEEPAVGERKLVNESLPIRGCSSIRQDWIVK